MGMRQRRRRKKIRERKLLDLLEMKKEPVGQIYGLKPDHGQIRVHVKCTSHLKK